MRGRIAIAASLALVASLFGPISASNAALVTKTFTVTKSDGSVYPNVHVGLFGWSNETGKPIFSSVVQTNSSGVAAIQVEDQAQFWQWSVQPPANDFTHAPAAGELVVGATETIAVRLKTANTKVLVQTSDGSAPPLGTGLAYPSAGQPGDSLTWVNLLRPGGFGLDLSTSMSLTGKFELYLAIDYSPGNYYRNYGVTRSVNNGVSSFNLFSDLTYQESSRLSTTSVAGHDVYVLRLNGANLFGSLRSQNGSSLAFGSPLIGEVQIQKSTTDGYIDPEWGGSWTEIEADGTFRTRLDSPKAGRYFAVFRVAGSHSIPTFIGPSFFIDSNGNYSMSESGPFVSPSTFRYVIDAPSAAQSLKIRVIDPVSRAAVDAYLNLNEFSNYGWHSYGPGRASNGLASYLLRDGSYDLLVNAVSSALVEQTFKLVVDQGQYSLKNKTGQLLTANAEGIYEVPLATPNLKLKIVNPNDPSVILDYHGVEVRNATGDETDDPVAYGNPINGIIPLALENGTYKLTVLVNRDNFAPRDYTLSVSNGTITLTDTISGSTVSPSGGVYSVIPAPTNVFGRLVSPTGQALSQEVRGFSLRLERKVGNSWRYFTWLPSAKSDGTFAFRVNSTGDFRLVVFPNDSAKYAKSTYEFTVSNTGQNLNLGDKSLRESNFKVKLVTFDTNETIPYANVQIVPETATVTEADFEGWMNSTLQGLAGIELLATGTYKITVFRPYNYPSNQYANTTYTLTVGGTPGNLTFSIPGITSVDGVFALPLGSPNVSGVVVSPTGQNLVVDGGKWVDVVLRKQTGSDWDWIDSVNTSRGGEFGFKIQQNGIYRLEVRPTGFADFGRVLTETFEITNANRNTLAKNFSALALRAPTAKLGVVVPGSSTLVSSYIDIRKLDQFGETIGFDYLYSGNGRIFNYTADSAGTYEFTVNPDWNNQLESVAKSYRGTVTGTGPSDFALSIPGSTTVNGVMQLALGSPNIRGRVVASNGDLLNLNNSWVNIALQKFDSAEQEWWWSGGSINMARDGRFSGLVTEPGTYRLRLSPYGLTGQTLSYSNSFTITQAGLASFNQNFGDLRLGAPNLTGEVLAPTGTTKISQSQVIAIDAVTGREVWESSNQTNSEGKWFMNLPAGRYTLMARAPWRSVTYGDSGLIENVVVANNGSVTIGGSPASSNIQIRLSTPTWSGTVVDPNTSEPMPETSVCLWHYESDRSSNSCSYTDNQGRWALSKPAFFTGFNSSTTLSIHPRSTGTVVEKRLQGSLAVSQALGSYTPGNSYQNIVLSPAQPNVTITVKAGQTAAPNVWVNVTKPGVGWLAGGVTNNLGIAKLYIPNISGPLDIEAHTSGSLRETYATTKKSMTIAEVTSATSGSNFATEVSLLTPNLRAIIYKPGATPSTPGDPMLGSYLSILNETTNEWIGSYSANSLGEVPASLPVPVNGSYRYKIQVEPAGTNPELLMRSHYFATVQANGNLTLTTSGGSAVTAVGGKFPLILTAPTITGTVSSSDGSVRIRDSRILPTDITTRFDLWENAAYSNRAGEFGMILPNGSYFLVASPSWGQQTEARSARCQVDIFNGALVSPGSDCISNGKVNLKLRQPNLKFKLVHNGQPVRWARVSLSVGNWYVDASSTSDGSVALFIDSDEIAARNPGMSGTQDIRVNVEPNYDTAGIVRWNCNSGDSLPICSQLTDVTIGQTYSLANNGNLGDVAFMQPNTKLFVRAPGAGALKQNSWVTLFKQEQGWTRWLASDNTDANGQADFNLDSALLADASARYIVEIQAPWNERNTYARTQYRNLTYAQVNNQTFELRNPNLKLQIKQAFTGTESRWSYVDIQRQVDAQANIWAWHDWASADETGTTAVLLDVVGKYRLTAYPGSGARGTQVTCELEVTSNANVLTIAKVANLCDSGGNINNGTLEINLSPGNLRGTIAADGNGIAGAIVFAQAVSDDLVPVPIAGKTMETVTNSDGSYGLQLSDQYRWQVKVFFVNPGGAAVRYGSILTPLTVEKAELTANKTWNATLPRQ